MVTLDLKVRAPQFYPNRKSENQGEMETGHLIFSDAAGTWRESEVLIAMACWAVVLLIATTPWVIHLLQGRRKVPFVLVALCLSGPVAQSMIADVIANWDAEKGEVVSLHLLWGNPLDVAVTVMAAPLLACIGGLLLWLLLRGFSEKPA